MAMALLYNVNRDEHARAEPPASFMPYHDDVEEDISEEELQSKLRSLTGRLHKV
jgi:hypothetical protein